MKKTILIIGSNGMAGHIISEYLSTFEDFNILRVSRDNFNFKNSYTLDVSNFIEIKKLINNIKPSIVINAIGILNKDAETNPDKAILINSFIPHLLAKECSKISASLIHLSTDCVFSGNKGSYVENDFKDGLGFYAQSKALGEVLYDKHLTIRTSIIGPDLKESGIGLFNWVLNQKYTITGYTEAIWGGVTTLELAKSINHIIRLNDFKLNLIQLTNGKKISKFSLIEILNDVFSLKLNIIASSEYKVDKSLINTSNFIYQVPDYKTMIVEMYDWILNHSELYKHYNIL
jgi:dTDP-4-dehydrorhamnose reductase